MTQHMNTSAADARVGSTALASEDIARMAQALDEATRTGVPITQWAKLQPLTLAQAYAVQAEGLRLRLARGDAQVGWKLAFTNRNTMARTGVAAPVSGYLCRDMQLTDSAELDTARLIRPRAEPEVAFRIGRALRPGVDAAQALAGVDAVAAAIEIVDSRYRDFQFSLPDVVADSTSGCGFVLGAWRAPDLDLADLAVQFEVDGEVVMRGGTRAILDHPLQALLAAVELAAEAGQPLKEGDILLAGSATDPVVLKPGTRVAAHVQHLGRVGFSIAAR